MGKKLSKSKRAKKKLVGTIGGVAGAGIATIAKKSIRKTRAARARKRLAGAATGAALSSVGAIAGAGVKKLVKKRKAKRLLTRQQTLDLENKLRNGMRVR